MKSTRKKIEKTQISVRFDKRIADLIYALAEKTDQRFVDTINDLALEGLMPRLEEPPITGQARYLISKADLDTQWLHTLFDVYLAQPFDDDSMQRMDRESFKEKLYLMSQQKNFLSVLKTLVRERVKEKEPYLPGKEKMTCEIEAKPYVQKEDRKNSDQCQNPQADYGSGS